MKKEIIETLFILGAFGFMIYTRTQLTLVNSIYGEFWLWLIMSSIVLGLILPKIKRLTKQIGEYKK